MKQTSTKNQLTVAGANDVEAGVLTGATFAAGDNADLLLTTAAGTSLFVASGAIAIGALFYADAGGKVTATQNGIPIGIALTAASANNDIIEGLRLDLPNKNKLFTSVVASTAVTNTTTETLFDQSFTIPANMLAAGDRLKIKAQGSAPATNSTDTLTAKLYIGGLAGLLIASTGALDVANNDAFFIDADLTIRTAGVSGTVVGTGWITIGTPGTATAKQFVLASSTLDTTASKVVGVSATWSVANAGDSCRLDMLDIERVPA
jgi:hypothetical protein